VKQTTYELLALLDRNLRDSVNLFKQLAECPGQRSDVLTPLSNEIQYVRAQAGFEVTSRLRVIYDNGTESDVFQRSFQRALHRDEAARLITNRSAGPLFAEEPEGDDLACDTIYVLRSKSDNPVFAANRDVLHKIGVTGGKIETRLANAAFDPTFLLADVEVVTTYVLYNVNRAKLENLIHRVFDAAQFDIEIKDRFGNSLGLGNR